LIKTILFLLTSPNSSAFKFDYIISTTKKKKECTCFLSLPFLPEGALEWEAAVLSEGGTRNPQKIPSWRHLLAFIPTPQKTKTHFPVRAERRPLGNPHVNLHLRLSFTCNFFMRVVVLTQISYLSLLVDPR
jgi:hypothetical protein